MTQTKQTKQYVMLDIETTGLDEKKDQILEIAAVALDDDLRPLNEGVEIVLTFGPGGVPGLSDFIRDMHTKNGLLAECANKTTYDRPTADALLACYLLNSGCTSSSVVLCGHTIDFDHRFITAQLPRSAGMLHYRKMDFGALGRFLVTAGLGVSLTPKEAFPHRAMADVRLEIDEAQRLLQAVRRLIDDSREATVMSNQIVDLERELDRALSDRE